MSKIISIQRIVTDNTVNSIITFKGCSLNCPWCNKPETKTRNSKLSHDEKKCIDCHKCAEVCQKGAIDFIFDSFNVDYKKCDFCQDCINVCLTDAIKQIGIEMENDKIVDELIKHRSIDPQDYGSVIIQGGEPLIQINELIDLLKKLKANDFKVIVETTGSYHFEMLNQSEPYVDMFVYNLKHMKSNLSDVIHTDITNVLENLKKLAKIDYRKIILKVEVIPGFNYEDRFLIFALQTAKKLKINDVIFLPYKNKGYERANKINQEYEWNNIELEAFKLEKYLEFADLINVNLRIDETL